MRRLRTALAVALGAGMVAAPVSEAAAELFRCEGPDGRTIFTDNKARCPGREPFEPEGEVQKATPSSEAPAAVERGLAARKARAEARKRAYEAQEAEARRWRDVKQQREAALRELLEEREALEEFVTWCNRGGYVTRRDDAGIKRRVSCTKIQADYDALDEIEAKARAKLEALPEECRRAGCLPGWIR